MSDEYAKAEPQKPPLIEAVPDMSALPPAEVRVRAVLDDGLDYSTAVTRDVAGRMYHDKDAAMQALLSRYEQTGDAPKLLSELERDPAILGEMKGKTRLGLANGERRNALEITPQLTEKAGEVFRQVGLAEARIVTTHAAKQAARAKPLPDLSENAQQFLSRVAAVEQMSPGEAKNTQRADLMKDRQSQREVTAWRQALSERYGKGTDKIREGVKAEPTIKAKPAPERQAALTRVDNVLTGFPMMVNMRSQAKQHERNRSLAQDQSRGIER